MVWIWREVSAACKPNLRRVPFCFALQFSLFPLLKVSQPDSWTLARRTPAPCAWNSTRARYSKIIHPKHGDTSPSNQTLALELTLQLHVNSEWGSLVHVELFYSSVSTFMFGMGFLCCRFRVYLEVSHPPHSFKSLYASSKEVPYTLALCSDVDKRLQVALMFPSIFMCNLMKASSPSKQPQSKTYATLYNRVVPVCFTCAFHIVFLKAAVQQQQNNGTWPAASLTIKHSHLHLSGGCSSYLGTSPGISELRTSHCQCGAVVRASDLNKEALASNKSLFRKETHWVTWCQSLPQSHRAVGIIKWEGRGPHMPPWAPWWKEKFKNVTIKYCTGLDEKIKQSLKDKQSLTTALGEVYIPKVFLFTCYTHSSQTTKIPSQYFLCFNLASYFSTSFSGGCYSCSLK